MDKSDIKQISDELSGIIKAHVTVSGRFSGQMSLFRDQDSIKNKINALERMLEITRIENKYLENKLALIINCRSLSDNNSELIQKNRT